MLSTPSRPAFPANSRAPLTGNDKASERELQAETERHRLHRQLQETQAALETSTAAAAAANAAEQEAAALARQERRLRESAEIAATESEERSANLETESAELREEAGRVGVRLGEAREREGALRGLLEKAENARVVAGRERDAVNKETVGKRAELLEARRRVEEGEAELRELTAQVRHAGMDRVGCCKWEMV